MKNNVRKNVKWETLTCQRKLTMITTNLTEQMDRKDSQVA